MTVASQYSTPSSDRVKLLTYQKTLSIVNTTGSEILFRCTGGVLITRLWGVVITPSTNMTAAYFRLNDQTAQPAITLAAGIVLSGLAAGTMFAKTGLAAAALSLWSNAAGVISEPATAGIPVFSPFAVVKKTAANTDIEFRYTTTNSPAAGVFKFYVEYAPLTDDGSIATV